MSALEFVCSRLVSVTAWMAVAAIVVQLLLSIIRPVSPRAHRLAWACVILSGVLFVRMPIDVSEHRLDQAIPRPLQVVVAPIAESKRSADSGIHPTTSLPARSVGAALATFDRRLGESRAEFQNEGETPPATQRTDPADSAWTWRRAAAAVWGLGAAAIVLLNFVAYFRFVRRTGRMRSASGEFSREWTNLLAERNVRRPLPLLVSDDFGPAFCLTSAGYRLVVPEKRWESLLQAERMGILRHELAHYERNDLFKSLLVRCVVVLHWFNPAAWWAQRQFERAGEWACDDVAGGREGRIEFAKVLMQFGGARFPSVPPLADAVAGGPLHNRIRRLLSLTPVIDRPWKTLVVTTLSAAVIAIALVRINRVADAAAVRPPAVADQAPSHPAVATKGDKTNFGPLADAGIVTGQVFDVDGKTPVAQALVTLQIGGGIWQTHSDAKGDFRFERRGAPWYDVWASKANFVTNKEHIRNAAEEDSPKSRFPTVRLTMGPGKQLTVRATAKQTGRPIAGTRIRLIYPNRRTAETDAWGNVSIPGLRAEQQLVVAEAAGFARWAGEFDLGNTAGELAIVISLEPGGRVEGTVTDEGGRPVLRAFMNGRRVGSPTPYYLDSPRTDRLGRFHDHYLPLDTPIQMALAHEGYLRCEPQQFTLTAQNPKAELHFILKRSPHLCVEGVVTDEKGKPLAGATVFNHGHSSGEVQKMTTDARGKFAIADLLEGNPDYAIDVRARGFAPGHEIVRAAPGSAAHVTVQLKPGHFVHGRVVGDNGKPIPDAHVHFNSAGFFWGMEDDATRTDDQGRFMFDTLPDLCTFQIEHPGYSVIFDKRLPLDRPNAVVITMSPTLTLRGHVFAADTGKPIEQFEISNAGLQPTTFRSKDGLFALRNVHKDRDGRVHSFLRVRADGFRAKSLQELLDARGLGDAILEVPLERLDLSKLTSVSGRIVDDRDRPVAGAQLRLIVTAERPANDHDSHYNWFLLKSDQLAQRPERCDQYLSVASAADGKFEFKNVLAGKFLQLAYWGQHVPEGRSLAFDKTEPRVPQTITIKLPKPAAIRGTIDLTSIPNAGEIQAMPVMDPWHLFQVRLKADQTTFELNDLPPGTYNVLVASKLVPSKENPRMSTSTTLASWQIHLNPGETAHLKFSDAKIEPPADSR